MVARRLLPLLCATALVTSCGVKNSDEEADAKSSEAADLTPEGPSLISKLIGGGKPMPLDVQVPHANGLILQVDSLQAKPTETVITATIINGDDRENALNQYGNDDTYIVGADGAKLYLSPPANNEKLNIPAGQKMQAELVFLGRLSKDGQATLIVNDGDDTGNQYTDTPGFRIPLVLPGAAFSDDGSKKN